MGVFSFLKSAGASLFGGSESPEEKAQKVKDHLSKQGFDMSDVTISVDDSGNVTLNGQAKNFDEQQKMLATAGNVEGVEQVNDNLTLKEPLKIEVADVTETFYTVQSGDSLSKISKEVYGDPNKYTVIFEANKPMLAHPDKIYPGQVLYVPPQA